MATPLSHPHLKPHPSPAAPFSISRCKHWISQPWDKTGYVNSGNFDTIGENNCHKNEFSRSYPNFVQLLYKGPKSAQKLFIDFWNTKTMDSVSSSSNNEGDVSEVSNANHLMYRFDVDGPWKYFSDGVPVASSVERGRKKTNPKHTKIYITKQKKSFTARKNRAHGDIAKMCLLFTCEQDCLMKQGEPSEIRLMIQQLRQRLFRKDYNEQNYILARSSI